LLFVYLFLILILVNFFSNFLLNLLSCSLSPFPFTLPSSLPHLLSFSLYKTLCFLFNFFFPHASLLWNPTSSLVSRFAKRMLQCIGKCCHISKPYKLLIIFFVRRILWCIFLKHFFCGTYLVITMPYILYLIYFLTRI